jgi:putative nucleotidyltransferase with HDIG domain
MINEQEKIHIITEDFVDNSIRMIEESFFCIKTVLRNNIDFVAIETFTNEPVFKKTHLLTIDGAKCVEVDKESGSVIDFIKKTNQAEELKSGKFLSFENINYKKNFNISGKSKTGNVNLFVLPLTVNNLFFGLTGFFSFKKTAGIFSTENLDKKSIVLFSLSVYNYNISKKMEELDLEIDENYHNIIELLVTLIEIRDPYTSGHSKNVKAISIRIAEALNFTFKNMQYFDLSYAALLHDIGKINVGKDVLNKKGRLNSKERMGIIRHSTQGAFLVSNIPRLKNIANIILHHHERFDGSGYPMGIAGEQIPLFSRIISLADTFDAMTSDRSYRKAIPKEKALEIIISESGRQFDPAIVKCFIENNEFILRDTNKNSLQPDALYAIKTGRG